MSNINDYLKWRGDISLKYDELNEIDELILARYSYFPFFKIEMESEETISDISKKMSKFTDDEYNYLGDMEMNELIGKSARFKNLKVTDYKESNDQDEEKQFSAITITLNDEVKYISFLGTDKSIIGWKEDFNLSFTQDIPAQIEALKYANNIMKKYPNSKFIFGGHSKGGNNAIYAAINSSLENKARIIKVLNYDGPGFPEEIIESDKFIQIKEKIHTYLPQESIIGRIMDQGGKVTVVTSTEKNIYQHDIYSWQIKNRSFVRSKTTKRGDLINHTINKWMQSATQEEMKIFIDGMFEIFTTVKLNNPIELMREWKRFAPKIVKEFLNTPKEQKKAISDIWWRLGESLIRSRIEQSELLAKFNRTFKKSELRAQKHSGTKSRREKIF